MSNQVKIPSDVVHCFNYIGGEWTKGSGEIRNIHSPYTGALIGKLYESTATDVDVAVSKAQKVFGDWSITPIKERCKILFEFRNILLKNLENIPHTISSESGKTLEEAKAGLLKGIEVLEFALSLQNLDFGSKMEVSSGVFCECRREPLGVVAGITPFNFPAMVPMWMIPIAIALGNCFLWKPSDKTPLTSLLLAEAFKKAGLPSGVFTVIQGGKSTVQSVLDHPDIKAVGFVGSTPVAQFVYQYGSAHFKRILALGGAKNHLILMPDADQETSAQAIVDSFTGCAGQRCMAASVLLAVGDVDHLITKIIKLAQQKILAETMGAIITKESKERLIKAIDKAEYEGAKIVVDGRKISPLKGFDGGNWLGPTIIDDVKRDQQVAREELFGPILSVVRCKSLQEALSIENACPFGNACSVFTQNGAIAELVAQKARSGMIGVNIGVPVPREPFSFGGVNQSKFGHGDITGLPSLNFWTDLKKVTVKWSMKSAQDWMS